MSQNKWKKSDMSNASDRTNPAIIQEPTDHDLGHPKA